MGVRAAAEEALHPRAVDARIHLPLEFAMEGEDERCEVVVVVLAARIAGEVELFDFLAEVGLRCASGRVAFGHRAVAVVIVVVVVVGRSASVVVGDAEL